MSLHLPEFLDEIDVSFDKLKKESSSYEFEIFQFFRHPESYDFRISITFEGKFSKISSSNSILCTYFLS